jgi:hypothetical protein
MKENKIKDFIKENNLSLEIGSRNSSLVTIIGFSQHLGLTEGQLTEELNEEIEADSFIGEEINRLWDYCKLKKYKTYWLSPDAKSKYKF